MPNARCLKQMNVVDVFGYEPTGLSPNILFGRTNYQFSNYLIFKFSNWFVEDIGVEPMTLCVQGRCSSQLS